MLLLMHDSSRLAGGLPRRALRGRRAGGRQHAAHRPTTTPTCSTHSRARAALVSAALLPTSAAGDGSAPSTRCQSWSSRSERRRCAGAHASRAADARRRRPAAAPTACATTSLSGSIRPARPAAQGHGAHACEPLLDRRAVRASRCSALREDDVVFSAAKLFFAYGLGNALTFPLSVGATDGADGGAADAAAVFKRSGEHRPTDLLRRADALCRACSPSPDLPARERCRAAVCVVGRRGAAARDRRALHARISARDPRRHRLDRNAAHLPVEPARRRRYGTTGKPVPGYDVELRDERRPAGRRAAKSAIC